jgi:hypothetical protein
MSKKPVRRRVAVGAKALTSRKRLEAGIGLLSTFFRHCAVIGDPNVQALIFAKNEAVYNRHFKSERATRKRRIA